MQANSGAHPHQNQLSDFALGKLESTEVDLVESHLASCATCCETVKQIQADTFVGLVRQAKDDGREPPSSGDSPRAAAPVVAGPAEIADAATVATASRAPRAEPEGAATVAPATMVPGACDQPAELANHGRYRILQLLGAGGMGSVYLAEHRLMQRTVALKVIDSKLVASKQAVERFRREVQAAARLDHPNIVRAFDAEQAGDVHFLVMEYVRGTDLHKLLAERGPLPVAEACEYIRQAAMGLQHAHENGMVHRDIKPQNLMVSRSREPSGTSSTATQAEKGSAGEAGPARLAGPTVKILDFGLASLTTEAALGDDSASTQQSTVDSQKSGLTQAGVLMGTPDYMAPEQSRDARTADIRSDIYSLGCTLYCLLSGQVPFPGGSALDKVIGHCERRPQPIGELRTDVPVAVVRVLDKMLAKSPADRYQTPAELVTALEQLAPAADPVASRSTQLDVRAGAGRGRANVEPVPSVRKRRGSERARFRLSLGCVSITIAVAFGLLIVSGAVTLLAVSRLALRPDNAQPLANGPAMPPGPIPGGPGNAMPGNPPGNLAPVPIDAAAGDKVKQSTVYLEVTMPNGASASGSGFFAVEPGIVITNAQVLGMLQAQSKPPTKVNVVINSGQPGAKTLRGTVLGVDRNNDLAVVRVADPGVGDPGLPLPLPVHAAAASLRELQEVYFFGFPFGKRLGAGISINRATVASIRKDRTGVVTQVQLAGDMPPGSSGGPVVDAKGRVIGIAGTVIKGTRSSFAVTADLVEQMLDGRIEETQYGDPFVENNELKMPVKFHCLDPLRRVKALRVEVWAGKKGMPRPASNHPPVPLPGDSPRTTFSVNYEDGIAVADVPMPAALESGQVYWFQPVLVDGAGATRRHNAWSCEAAPWLRRIGADLQMKLNQAGHRTVKINDTIRTTTIQLGKNQFSQELKFDAMLLETVTPGDKGATIGLSIGPNRFTEEDPFGKIRVLELRYSNLIRQLAPNFLVNVTGKVIRRTDPGFGPTLAAEDPEKLLMMYLRVASVFEQTCLYMPNRLVAFRETWPAKVPMIVGKSGGNKQVMDVDLVCTYLGSRLKAGGSEAVIGLSGSVRGRQKSDKEGLGSVTGRVVLDLDSGFISDLSMRLRTEIDMEGLLEISAEEINLVRQLGNPDNIPQLAPTGAAGKATEGSVAAVPRLLRTIENHSEIKALAYTPDGKSLIATGDALTVFDPANGEPTYQEKHKDITGALALSADGKTVAVASQGSIMVVDLAGRKRIKDIPIQSKSSFTFSLALSADGKTLVYGSDGTMRFHDLDTDKTDTIAGAEKTGIFGMRFTPDGRYLISTADDILSIRDANTRAIVDKRYIGSFGLTDISRDSKRLVVGSVEKQEPSYMFSVFNLPKGDLVYRETNLASGIGSLALSPDGNYLALGLVKEGTIKIWDLTQKKEVASCLASSRPNRAGRFYYVAVAFAPDGKTLATGGGSAIKLWDLTAER